MPNSKETLLDWLRDAHAMESSIVSMLEKQLAGLKDKPLVESKVKEHLEITKQQRTRVEGLIKKLGGNTSTVKEVTGKVMSNMQALALGMAPDSIVKNSIANFAVEHFEIASYAALVAAAEAQGETEVVRVCKEILAEEQEMANWLEHHLPRITQEYVSKTQTAKQ